MNMTEPSWTPPRPSRVLAKKTNKRMAGSPPKQSIFSRKPEQGVGKGSPWKVDRPLTSHFVEPQKAPRVRRRRISTEASPGFYPLSSPVGTRRLSSPTRSPAFHTTRSPPVRPYPTALPAFDRRSRVIGKKVRFASALEQVFVLSIDDSDDEAEMDDVNKENYDRQPQVATSTTRPTSEFTVLSSLHGQARRQLREITRFDLQSAVKYGVKTLGAPCPKSGACRWKYTYGNVVYITDETSRKEITSYREPISIHQAPVTAEMVARHEQDARMLLEDPHLCVTHHIIVIDQSGSMRTSDVHGFRNRSQAAYGVLALEYLADQLHQRGVDDKILEAVTVLEMQSHCHVMIHREPLDWMLFNKILDRQRHANPCDHGDYNQALLTSHEFIFHELQGIDPEDSPVFSMIFLSDGRPSDSHPDDTAYRQDILTEMANQLKPHFELHTIGLGKSSADFSSLKDMAMTVESCGCKATFSYSQLSGAQLGEAFSSISTSMTATRTEALSGKRGEAAGVPRPKKDVQLRCKSTPQDERIFRVETRGVSRWRYDKYLDDGSDDFWPWDGLPFKNKGAIGFEVEEEPFGKGAERLAHVFHEIGPGNQRLGVAMVAKETISVGNADRRVDFHEAFCRVQHKSNELAQRFNGAVARTPVLRPVDPSVRLPLVQFLKCHVYEYTADDGVKCGLLVEDFLQGKFIKYNSNNGFVRNPKGSPIMQLACGEVYMEDFLQAFSHWVYFSSEQKILICDLQGELNMEGVCPKFMLTDPCICSKRTKGKNSKFGRSDMGTRGFRVFRKHHVCNGVCQGLGLPTFGSRRCS